MRWDSRGNGYLGTYIMRVRRCTSLMLYADEDRDMKKSHVVMRLNQKRWLGQGEIAIR